MTSNARAASNGNLDLEASADLIAGASIIEGGSLLGEQRRGTERHPERNSPAATRIAILPRRAAARTGRKTVP
jgi:hypothetical protein